MDWWFKEKKISICRSCWRWKRCIDTLEKFVMSKKPRTTKAKGKWKKHMSKRRRGQLNPHLRNIRRQRTPENKACLPAGSTSSLTSSTCKACWRQIYKTCDENQKKVTVACITCILLLQLSGEGTCNNLQTKLSILDPSQQQTQAAVQIC